MAPLASIVAVVCASSAASAQTGSSDPATSFEKFAAQPGTEVTRRKAGDAEIIEARRSGVVIRQTRRGDKVETFEFDSSSHGAVLCTWMMYIELRAGLDLCASGQHAQLRDDLDSGISAMNGFIAANSLTPVSPAEVEKSAAAHDAGFRAHAPKERICRAALDFVERFSRTPRGDRRKALADSLSIPRPPVANPCL